MPTTRKVIGLWLCCYAMIGFFNGASCKSVFYVVSQEANKLILPSYCHIAREQAMAAGAG
jgi:hypothetical protein